jgi:small subunit ribosomal protein S7
MPRKFKSTEKYLKPDPRYKSLLVSKFINYMMIKGKKSTSQKMFYDSLDIIQKKLGEKTDPLEVFKQAIENVKPRIEVRSKRVGGATYQVPIEVTRKRQQSLAFRWIRAAARARKGMPMAQRLAEEFLAAYRREGSAIKTREDTHKMAEANKAFAHLAW